MVCASFHWRKKKGGILPYALKTEEKDLTLARIIAFTDANKFISCFELYEYHPKGSLYDFKQSKVTAQWSRPQKMTIGAGLLVVF